MGFQKGNTLAKKAVKAREQNKQNFWDFMASGGLRTYNELMNKLALDEPIGKNQIMFMDRSERTFPYLKARKTDITSNDKELTPLLVKFIKDESN